MNSDFRSTDKLSVSVVIPVFNGADYLHDTIESVLNQTYDSVHIIAIDDASVDDSQDILEHFANAHPQKITCLINNRNQGVVNTLKTGAKAGRGLSDIIMFLDQDDIIPQEFVDAVVAEFAGADCVAVQSIQQFIDSSGRKIGMGRTPIHLSWFGALAPLVLLSGNLVPGTGFAVKSTLLTDEMMEATNTQSHDWELVLKIATIGTIGSQLSIPSCYRIHEGSLSRSVSVIQQIEQYEQMLNNFILSETLRRWAGGLSHPQSWWAKFFAKAFLGSNTVRRCQDSSRFPILGVLEQRSQDGDRTQNPTSKIPTSAKSSHSPQIKLQVQTSALFATIRQILSLCYGLTKYSLTKVSRRM